MVQRLLKTLYCEQGKLYTIVEDRRILLAHCRPKLEILQQESSIPAIGRECKVKKLHVVLALCADMDFTRQVDPDFLQTVTRFELSADIQRTDGIFETMQFDHLMPDELELGGEWEFVVDMQPDEIRRLLTI